MPGGAIWLLKPTVDFLGASMHAAWHFVMRAQDFAPHTPTVATWFAAYGARAVVVTELQGSHRVHRQPAVKPHRAEITRWLWDGFGNGARGIVFWLCIRGRKVIAGEWGWPSEWRRHGRTRATRA
jgi:hypothetical protein